MGRGPEPSGRGVPDDRHAPGTDQTESDPAPELDPQARLLRVSGEAGEPVEVLEQAVLRAQGRLLVLLPGSQREERVR